MNHFAPLTNVTFKRHIFKQDGQCNGETIDDFAGRLRRLAGTFEFDSELVGVIRDQVVEGCLSSSLRKKVTPEG